MRTYLKNKIKGWRCGSSGGATSKCRAMISNPSTTNKENVLNNKMKKEKGYTAQVAQHLPDKQEALDSILCPAN
jgi:hypothetical protein